MCLLFALWFASGIIMMYVDYPELTYAESVAAHPNLQRDRVALTPFEAARVSGEVTAWESASLAMLADRPVYRLGAVDGRSATIFADTGERMERLGEQGALAGRGGFGIALGRDRTGIPRLDRNRSMDHHGLAQSVAPAAQGCAQRFRGHRTVHIRSRRPRGARHYRPGTILELARLHRPLDLSAGDSAVFRILAATHHLGCP